MRHDAMHEFAAVGTLQGRGRRAGWREAGRAIPRLRGSRRRRGSGPDTDPHPAVKARGNYASSNRRCPLGALGKHVGSLVTMLSTR